MIDVHVRECRWMTEEHLCGYMRTFAHIRAYVCSCHCVTHMSESCHICEVDKLHALLLILTDAFVTRLSHIFAP